MKFTAPRFNLVPTLLLSLLAFESHAQFIQQGSKLVGTGALLGCYGDGAHQGGSVAISTDGNTAIVAGDADNCGTGAVWVFTRSGGVWTQQGNKLIGTGAVGRARQGRSVAISADGNTAIVGGEDDNNQIGAAWVWSRSGGVWTQQGSKLVGTGTVYIPQQGRSVALSADGNTAIVGGPIDGHALGAAWVFTRSEGAWSQQGSKLVGTGATGIGVAQTNVVAYQGKSVALSADGNTAIVGGDIDNRFIGATWVFTRSGGVWTQQGNKLVGSDAVGSSRQGTSVALSADGNTAIVGGGSTTPANEVSTWVFTRSGSVWTQQGNKLVGAVKAYHISAIALSTDGNTALIGGNKVESPLEWTRTGGVWTQQSSKLAGTGFVGTARQGWSVSLSSDGNTAAVGVPYDSLGAGAVWVFTRNGAPVLPQSFTVQRLNLVNGKFLRFGLPQKEQVLIRLFNSQGRMITRLLDETREAGNYTVPISNEAQGAYFLDFRAGDYHETMKGR